MPTVCGVDQIMRATSNYAQIMQILGKVPTQIPLVKSLDPT